MTSPLRVGVLGCGYIARKAMAPALRRTSAARLEALSSVSGERARLLAEEFGGRAVTGYARLLEDPDVDCVYVALPNALHLEWVLRAAAAGKHVLCEKPAFLSLNDARLALETCAKHGVRLAEGYMFRFHPQHVVAAALVRDGAIGVATHVESAFGFPPLDAANFRYVAALGGGACSDAAGYGVSAARLLFATEPMAIWARLTTPEASEVDVRGAAMLEFPDGRSAHVAFGFDYAYRNTYSVWGSRGVLTVGRAFSMPPDAAASITVMSQGAARAVEVPAADHFERMVDAFAAVVKGCAVDWNPEIELYAQARVMEALRQAAREDRVVRCAEV